jgi:hypothetical protein
MKHLHQHLHLHLHLPVIPARHALKGFQRGGWMKTGHRKEKNGAAAILAARRARAQLRRCPAIRLLTDRPRRLVSQPAAGSVICRNSVIGWNRVRAALVRLERDGRIVKVPYKKPNRHDGECYKLAQIAPDTGPESARRSPPIPPCVTGARTECAPVPQSAPLSTSAELTQSTDQLEAIQGWRP